METWDAIVVGGGPAGLSAALWLGRYRRRTLLVDGGDYRNRWVSSTHGYLGSDGIDPAKLRSRAREDLERYATVTVREGTVSGATHEDGQLALSTDAETLRARRVVLATGVRDRFPEVEGFFDHYGKSVFNCPTCDGYEAKDKRVVVFGWDEDVASFARHLLEWASKVTIVTNGALYEAPEPAEDEIEVREENALALVGEPGSLRAVRLSDGEEIDAEMAFFTIDQKPANELAVELGCRLDHERCIVIDDKGKTTVDGVYAAGDIVPGPQLVQIAAASGTIAGLACARSLR